MRVEPRDELIGWTSEERRRNLHLVVNNARFLILPWIRCRNLASRALALVSRRLPQDWQARYGYRPVLLETFGPLIYPRRSEPDKRSFDTMCRKLHRFLLDSKQKVTNQRRLS